MARLILTITLCASFILSYGQETLTPQELETLFSQEPQTQPPLDARLFPNTSSTTEEVRVSTGSRSDEWSVDTEDWQFVDSTQSVYDEGGQLVESISLNYDEDQGWSLNSRSLHSYNDIGKPDTLLHESWNGEEWQVESRRISLYDAEGRISERKAESWDGSTWNTTTLSTYEYDEETGNIVVFSTFNASPPDFVLQNADRSEYTYDEQERRATVVSYTGQGDEWVLNRRELYEYSSPDSELLERLVYENYVMDEWMPIFQLLYEYEEDLITVGYIEFWAADTEEWTPGIRYLYEYEQQGGQNRLKLRLTQSWIDSTAVYQDQSSFEYTYTEELEISVRKDYDQDQGMMVPNSRTLTYLAVIVDTEELPASIKGLHLYPNPNDGNFTLDVSDADLDISSTLQLRCTDLQGRNLINRTVDPAGGIMEVQLPALSSGLYILHLTDGQQIWRQRMIVRQ